MATENELNELRRALEASPDNVYLRRLLINKLRGVAGYEQELEGHLNVLIRKEPRDLELKEALIEVYFAQKKYSTCLIIFEEIGNPDYISPETRLLVAKSYLKDGDQGRAGEVYRSAIEEDPTLEDEELDKEFRLSGDFDLGELELEE
ncbi:tetratricopeptide repeat protein, partial [Neolewinella agarilytica]